ncbi:hypothetical protein V6N13_086559 [Hibiscus sabdariffa]
MTSARARDSEKNALPAVPSSSQMATANSVSVSTANTNGAPAVTNLGIVGWDVKHVLTGASAVKLNGIKKPAINPPSDKGESRVCDIDQHKVCHLEKKGYMNFIELVSLTRDNEGSKWVG